MADSEKIRSIGERLNDKSVSLTDRFRALFTLKNIGGHDAIDWIAKSFDDSSALLKHELAYCLGQMQDLYAVPKLMNVLNDKVQETIVRHEAAEALGAIGSSDVLDVLEKYSKDPAVEVAETCQLAIERIRWLQMKTESNEQLGNNPYSSVDPAPPSAEETVETLRVLLLDDSKSLFERYRAMFSLRNNQSREAVLALTAGLKCSSALFRHEIAFVLGQMQHEAAVDALKLTLGDFNENPMVRHESAEALGSIATNGCLDALHSYLEDPERVVRESCQVALDMYEYEISNQFQYANGLTA